MDLLTLCNVTRFRSGGQLALAYTRDFAPHLACLTCALNENATTNSPPASPGHNYLLASDLWSEAEHQEQDKNVKGLLARHDIDISRQQDMSFVFTIVWLVASKGPHACLLRPT